MDLTLGAKTYIFLQFCPLSVKQMKNRDRHTIIKTAYPLDNDPCLKESSVPPEVVWGLDLTSLNTPPPLYKQ